jgi:hypothetical protein
MSNVIRRILGEAATGDSRYFVNGQMTVWVTAADLEAREDVQQIKAADIPIEDKIAKLKAIARQAATDKIQAALPDDNMRFEPTESAGVPNPERINYQELATPEAVDPSTDSR